MGSEFGEVEEEERQDEMKSWRRGFIKCRRREEPWGSHHEEARALKCEISEGLTEDEDSDEYEARDWRRRMPW